MAIKEWIVSNPKTSVVLIPFFITLALTLVTKFFTEYRKAKGNSERDYGCFNGDDETLIQAVADNTSSDNRYFYMGKKNLHWHCNCFNMALVVHRSFNSLKHNSKKSFGRCLIKGTQVHSFQPPFKKGSRLMKNQVSRARSAHSDFYKIIILNPTQK